MHVFFWVLVVLGGLGLTVLAFVLRDSRNSRNVEGDMESMIEEVIASIIIALDLFGWGIYWAIGKMAGV